VSARRLATAWLPAFGLQASARARPELKSRPLAREEAGRVSECSRLAAAAGVRAGQTPARARLLCSDLCLIRCDEEELSATRRDLVEAFLLVAPQVEWGGGGTFHLDAAGLTELHGSERAFLLKLLARVESLGLAARVGLASSRFASTAAARFEPGLTVVPEGDDAAFLAGRPLDLLPLPGRSGEILLERLRLLGVRTLGELAGFPVDSLSDRFGAELVHALRLARPSCSSPAARSCRRSWSGAGRRPRGSVSRSPSRERLRTAGS
jgi:nucleotidyltransferase/DNA polymerase involved in DNA repair